MRVQRSRHRRRPGRGCLVHRELRNGAADQPDLPGRQGDQVQAAAERGQTPAASPPAPTATCGSPTNGAASATTGGGVGRITPAGETTLFPEPPDLHGAPFEIVAGPDGGLYFDHAAIFTPTGQAIGRITTAGVISEFYVGLQRRRRGERGSPPAATATSGSLTNPSRRRSAGSRRAAKSPSSRAWRRRNTRSSSGRPRHPTAASTSVPTRNTTSPSNGSLPTVRSPDSTRASTTGPSASDRSPSSPTATSGSGSNGTCRRAGRTGRAAARRGANDSRPAGSPNTAAACGRCPASPPRRTHPGAGREHLVQHPDLGRGRARRADSTPAIGRITPGGKITEFRYGLNDESEPTDLVFASGRLWFLDRRTEAIGEITPARRPPNTFLVSFPQRHRRLSSKRSSPAAARCGSRRPASSRPGAAPSSPACRRRRRSMHRPVVRSRSRRPSVRPCSACSTGAANCV